MYGDLDKKKLATDWLFYRMSFVVPLYCHPSPDFLSTVLSLIGVWACAQGQSG